MTSFKMKLPIICLGCPFQSDVCILSGRMITEEYLYDKKPDHCFLKESDKEGWVTLDVDKMPPDTVIGLDMTDIDGFSLIEPM